MMYSKKPRQIVTKKDLEEVDLSLNEIILLASKKELSNVFGLNGSDITIPIKRIKSQLTGTYDREIGEFRCDFNTEGIKQILGTNYEVYVKPRSAPTGLRYNLYIEKKGDK
ncbi:MAG: hypothetical protein WC584_01295 [Candidatus Pacearchaeota archaeon]